MNNYVSAVFELALAFLVYLHARRNGTWSWPYFALVLGAAVLFIIGFILPVASAKSLQAHTGKMVAIIFAGTLVFILAIVDVLVVLQRRKKAKAAQLAE
jgi:uncharacterized membrane protein